MPPLFTALRSDIKLHYARVFQEKKRKAMLYHRDGSKMVECGAAQQCGALSLSIRMILRLLDFWESHPRPILAGRAERIFSLLAIWSAACRWQGAAMLRY